MASTTTTTVATGAASGPLYGIGRSDPFEILTAQHVVFKKLLTDLDSPLDNAQLFSITQQLIHDVSAHTSVEERYLQPLFKTFIAGDEGQRFYDDSISDDNRDKTALDELMACDPAADKAKFRELLGTVKASLLAHMAKEENVWWPRLKASLPPAELTKLRDNIITGLQAAPTRPHSWTGPSTGTAAKVMHPVAGGVDRSVDKMMGRGGISQQEGERIISGVSASSSKM